MKKARQSFGFAAESTVSVAIRVDSTQSHRLSLIHFHIRPFLGFHTSYQP